MGYLVQISCKCKKLAVCGFTLSLWVSAVGNALASPSRSQAQTAYFQHWSPEGLATPQVPIALRKVVWQNSLNVSQDFSRQRPQLLGEMMSEIHSTPGFGSLYSNQGGESKLNSAGLLVKLNSKWWGEFDAAFQGTDVGFGSYSLGMALVPLRFLLSSRRVGVGVLGGLTNLAALHRFSPVIPIEQSSWTAYAGGFLSWQLTNRLNVFVQAKVNPHVGAYHLLSFAADI